MSDIQKKLTRLEDLKVRIMAVELLKAAKTFYTYRNLSARTGLQITVLSRYIRGHILPNSARARFLIEILKPEVDRFLLEGQDITERVLDITKLKIKTRRKITQLLGKRVTKILTDANPKNVAEATLLAAELDIPLIIAEAKTIEIPKRAIRARDSALIIAEKDKLPEIQEKLARFKARVVRV